jgi:trehalose-6-phosphate synthase
LPSTPRNKPPLPARPPETRKGVNPRRLLEGFGWPEFQWRLGELRSQFEGRKLLVAVDDMDVFKGIELKLQVR